MDLKPAVYVIDDDDAVRESLELLLDSVGQQTKSYDSAQSFLDSYSNNMLGCIVLDIRMPGMNGMELQKELNRLGSILPIIFVTGHGDVPMAVEAMQHGAVDFVQKPYREQELLDKINQALALDTKQRASLLEKQAIRERLSALTARESEVMEELVEGKANKVIAAELGISQRTVEIHRSRVMEKMGTHSLAHLVRMVLVSREET
ncbi:LuxR family two component transcriptional regulator [Sinobacterium caligoides]|uniref:LuxR family two component transcriptional regulator n=1 Tax=Sinobacterium caligoides TaxID=933926 RepID=A0A3N2D518_9GAMM|nr:response regulator FixJ [Sinobacterium caligoides]ROR94871.1 LuxR family two component transcriptional regulator [Sinobacterium caligoides]